MTVLWGVFREYVSIASSPAAAGIARRRPWHDMTHWVLNFVEIKHIYIYRRILYTNMFGVYTSIHIYIYTPVYQSPKKSKGQSYLEPARLKQHQLHPWPSFPP